MTTDTSTTTPPATGMSAAAQADAAAGAASMPDVRPQLQAALDLAVATARAVRADRLANPTPCPEFDVDALLRHLAGAADRAVVAGTLTAVPELADPEGDATAVVDLLAASAAAYSPAWAADTSLDRLVVLPWATLPARVLLGIYLAEVSTHTWDLAVATGQAPAFDDAAVEAALATMRMGLPAEGRGETPFGEVQPVADDAPPIDRLVAWTGRNPNWTPA